MREMEYLNIFIMEKEELGYVENLKLKDKW